MLTSRIRAGLAVAGAAGGLLLSTAGTYAATTATPSPARLAEAKQRGDAMISARLTKISTYQGRVTNAKHLTDGDRGQLQSLLTSDASGLQQLKTKLDSETTVSAALQDDKDIVANFRIYALVGPQVGLTIAADTITFHCTASFPKVETDLQNDLAKHQKAGQDTSQPQAHLQDGTSSAGRACNDVQGISSGMLALTPSAYNSNKGVVAPYLSRMQDARAHIKTAVTDFHAVIVWLKANPITH